MAIEYLDTFNRPDTTGVQGLGIIPEGPGWEIIRGTWRIRNNQAYADTPRDDNPIAVADLGENVLVGVDISTGGGDALYFRVVDQDNWWRIRLRRWTTSSTYYVTEYEWARDYVHSIGSSCGAIHYDNMTTVEGWSGDTTLFLWGSSSISSPSFPTCYGDADTHSHDTASPDTGRITHTHQPSRTLSGANFTGRTRTVPGGTTTNVYHRAYVEVCVDGVITTQTTTSGSVSRLEARIQGDTISAFKNGSSTPFFTTESEIHSGATHHGIGRGPSDTNGQGLDNFSVEIDNSPPFAPILTNPAAGQTINRGVTQRFRAQFNDPNSNDYQTSLVGEIRRSSDSVVIYSWDEETPNQYHDVPANTLPEDSYDWRAYSRDSYEEPGPWSSWTPFTAATAPAGPIYTNLVDGQTIAIENFVTEWSFSGQERYQFQRVADNEGAMDLGTVYEDIERVTSSTSHQGNFSVNDRWEWVRTRGYKNGLWSPWTEVRVFVDYVAPARPTLEVSPSGSRGVVDVTVFNTPREGLQPQVQYIDLLRRRKGDEEWVRLIRIYDFPGLWEDRTAAARTTYEYKATAHGANDTTTDSSLMEAPPFELWGSWIHAVNDPEGTMHQFRANGNGGAFTWSREVSIQPMAGRRLPFAEEGENETESISVELSLDDDEGDEEAFQALLEARSVLCYRDRKGHKLFGVIPSGITREARAWGEVTSLEIVGVDYNETA